MKHIKTIMQQPKPEKPKINVLKGEMFYLLTSSYSSTERLLVTALKDIRHEDSEAMHSYFKEFEDSDNKPQGWWETLDYQFIGAYLYLKGFISAPSFFQELCFHYSTDINEAYIDSREYDTKEFYESVETLRKVILTNN